MPELSHVVLTRPDGKLAVVSLVRNRAHSNVAQLFGEAAVLDYSRYESH